MFSAGVRGGFGAMSRPHSITRASQLDEVGSAQGAADRGVAEEELFMNSLGRVQAIRRGNDDSVSPP